MTSENITVTALRAARMISEACGADTVNPKIFTEAADEIERLADAHTILLRNHDAAITQRAQLLGALTKALALQDAMLTELAYLQQHAGAPPNLQLIAAKSNFDAAMKKLLEPEPPS